MTRDELDLVFSDPVVRITGHAKAALLRGPLYSDDPQWEALLRHPEAIEKFFAEIGVVLVLNRTDGYAYLDQIDEGLPGSEFPKLFYKDRFTYDVTLVAVAVRETLLLREARPGENTDVITLDDLMKQLRPYSRKKGNVEKEDDRWREAIRKFVRYGFLKRLKAEEETYLIRPIIRAKFPIDRLQEIKRTLEQHVADSIPSPDGSQ